MIQQNPFTSKTFLKIWECHFNSHKTSYSFNFIKELKFFKKSSLPIYINLGKNLTKGISYFLDQDKKIKDFKNKTCLIYDVPQYFDITSKPVSTSLRVKKIKQYPGYLIQQKNYTDFNDYFKKTFSKSSVQKFNRYKKRLESCFNIKEKMLIGDVPKAEYDTVFNYFNILLTKRFDDKQTTNNNLNPEEWAFYYEVAYPMILEKKAALHVIYNEETPISIRLLYFSKTIVFDAITVFDIDYSKFHIGKIAIMNMLEWSFKSDYEIFDFSKGYFDYKESWSDLKYHFEYHIYYDSASLTSKITATTLSCFFKLKQYMREKELNTKLHKLRFLLNKPQTRHVGVSPIGSNENPINLRNATLSKIDINKPEYAHFKRPVYDFLFLNSEHLNDVNVFIITDLNNTPSVLIKGKHNELILSTSPN